MTIVHASYSPPHRAPVDVVREAWRLYRQASSLYNEERRKVRARLAKRVRSIYRQLKRRAVIQATIRAQALLEQQLLSLASQWQHRQSLVRQELIDAATSVIREVVAAEVQHPHALMARIETVLAQQHGRPEPHVVLHPQDRIAIEEALPTLCATYSIVEDSSLIRGSVGMQVAGGMLVLNWQSHLEHLLEAMQHDLTDDGL